jgi:myosin I
MIVSHPFFKMAFIPELLDSSCKAAKPSWASIRPPTPEVIRRGYSESWWRLCKASGVGEFAKGRCFPVVGAATITSVVKDVEREIKANLAPTVPITAGTVYLPFVSDRKDRSQHGPDHLSEIAEERESSAESAQLIEISGNDRKLRQPNAASLKAQPMKFKENVAPKSPRSEHQPDPGSLAIRRARSTKGRMEGSRRAVSRDIPALQTLRAPSDPAKPTVRSALIIERPQPPEAQQRQPLPRSNSTARHKPTSQEDQHDNEEDQLVRPMANLILERPVRPRTTRPISQITQEKPRKPENAEISRQQRPVPLSSGGKDSVLPFTDPITVLSRATQLRDNLLAAVSGKERNLKMKKHFRQLPFVSKWVDYSKKHGIGYVLADGSIGCVFNATSRQPVTHVVVRNGHSHLRKPGNDSIAISQIPLEFYSDGTTDAIKTVPMEGDRRRLNGILWAKFGNYMCQTLSNDTKRKETVDSAEETKLIVRYYQRLGTVGVWGFSDGCFQVCFWQL